jgi:hypothetical protein
MNTPLLAGLMAALALTVIVAVFVIRRRRAPVTFSEDPTPVIPLYDVEEEARKVRALAYAQKMGNCHALWGGAAGQPPF